MKEDNSLYGETVEKLIKLSSIVDPSDKEHYIDFSEEDFINYKNNSKIVAIDMGSGYLSVIASSFKGLMRIAVPFSDLCMSEQIFIGDILDKYLSENINQ